MSKETDLERIIPNEVILVGKLRKDDDTSSILLVTSEGAPRDMADIVKDVMAKFKFIRETNPSDAAKAVGFQQGKFFHIQMGDPGGEKITLGNGKIVRRSRRTSKPGFDVIFQSNKTTVFEDIKEELLAKRIALVGGDPNSGKIALTEYALMGFWDEFPTGFFYTPHLYDPKQGGKLVPLMSHPKKDDGTYDKVGVKAISNMGRQFVYEDEVHQLEALRDKFRNNIREEWKVKVTTNTGGTPAGTSDPGAPEVKPPVVPPPPGTPDPDDL